MASSWETIYQNEIRNVGKNKYFHQKIKRKKQLINLIQALPLLETILFNNS